MRRRQYLRSAAGALALGSAAVAAGDAAGRDPTAGRPSAATQNGTAAQTDTPDDGFGPLGSVDISPERERGYKAAEAVTTPDGRYAFVAKLDGFHSVDLSTPSDPSIVATREDILGGDDADPLSLIQDLKYDRERLLVAGPANGSAPRQGIAVFDVSDPATPELIASHETIYAIHNCDLAGRFAYLTTGTELEVVDVGRDDPAPVAQWSVTDYDGAYADVPGSLRNLHDVYVEDDRAYLAYWEAGSWILDVSDPTEPSHLGHVADRTPEELAGLDREGQTEAFYEPPGNSHYVQPNDDGSLMAVGVESWDFEAGDYEQDEPEADDQGGPGGVTLWDVSDPSDPAELSVIGPPAPPEGETARRNGGYWTTAHNFDIVGDVLYTSWYRGGVRVHDISDPADPVEVAAWADGETASFWTARAAVPGEYFVASSFRHPTDDAGPGGLYVFPDPTDNDATITPKPTSTRTVESTAGATPSANATETRAETPPPTDAENMPTETPVGSDETETAAPNGTEAAGSGGTAADGPASGAGPGFGPLAAVAGLGLGAWRLLGDERDAK